jgi:hypothetical protein
MNKTVENKVIWKQNNPREINPAARKSSSATSSSSTPDGAASDANEALHRATYPVPTTVVKREDTPPLFLPMRTHWEDPALCRFFSDYVLEPGDVAISLGYLDHLPKLYGEATDEILTHAISAASLASFSNQVRSNDLLIAARKSYGKALVLLKKAFSNSSQVKSDGTLAGVFFCNMYEVCLTAQ